MRMSGSMNIYSLNGHKVFCHTFNAGYHEDKEVAIKYLELNKIYTVKLTRVFKSRCRTEVQLHEIPYVIFNSVFFKDVSPQNIEDDKKHWNYYRFNKKD